MKEIIKAIFDSDYPPTSIDMKWKGTSLKLTTSKDGVLLWGTGGRTQCPVPPETIIKHHRKVLRTSIRYTQNNL